MTVSVNGILYVERIVIVLFAYIMKTVILFIVLSFLHYFSIKLTQIVFYFDGLEKYIFLYLNIGKEELSLLGFKVCYPPNSKETVNQIKV